MLAKVCRWLGGAIGYLLYGLGVLTILLWLLFPRETIRRFVEQSLHGLGPDVRWQIGALRLDLPGGLHLEDIEGFGAEGETTRLLRIDRLTITPLLLPSLRIGTPSADYSLTIGKGSLSGTVRWQAGERKVSATGTARDVGLANAPLLGRLTGRVMEGTVSGLFEGEVRLPDRELLSLKGEMRVDEGRVGLQRSILGHRELPFSLIKAVVHGRDGVVNIEQGEVVSNLFDGRFAGTLSVQRDDLFDRLEVRGVLHPKNALFKWVDNGVALQAFRVQLKENTLPFTITGGLMDPGIHFEEYAMQMQTLERELK